MDHSRRPPDGVYFIGMPALDSDSFDNSLTYVRAILSVGLWPRDLVLAEFEQAGRVLRKRHDRRIERLCI